VDATGGAETTTGTPITGTGTIRAAQKVNNQTGASYTYLTGDRGKLIVRSNALAMSDTLPQPGVNFPDGWFIDVENRGAGTVTITPTSATINGAASLALTQDQGVRIVSDGTNYQIQRGMSSTGGGGGSTTRVLMFEFDGRGSAISSATIPQAVLPFSPITGTITEIYIKDLDDLSGTSELDVRKAARGSAPPGAGDSICGGSSNRPGTSSQSESTKTTFTGWTTTTISANDEVRLVVISSSAHKHLLVMITLTP
jgi:hypothetical protein